MRPKYIIRKCFLLIWEVIWYILRCCLDYIFPILSIELHRIIYNVLRYYMTWIELCLLPWCVLGQVLIQHDQNHLHISNIFLIVFTPLYPLKHCGQLQRCVCDLSHQWFRHSIWYNLRLGNEYDNTCHIRCQAVSCTILNETSVMDKIYHKHSIKMMWLTITPAPYQTFCFALYVLSINGELW